MNDRFDQFAMNLASGMSRRDALRGALAGAGAGLLALFVPSAANGAAPEQDPCKQGNKVKCGDKCCDRRTQFCCQSGGQSICCPSDAIACDILSGTITCLGLP